MAEPNNGMVVGPVRLLVLDVDGARRSPFDVLIQTLLADSVGRKAADARVYDADTDELLASKRFSNRRSAERARTLLAGLAGPDGTAAVDWVGELALLAGGATR